MELLAPAGSRENFIAAMDAGADAVYVGAPSLNARNLARDLQFEDIQAMVQYCHANGKKIYLAANSLVREEDLAHAVKTLALLEAMDTDGLIVQDLGLVCLIREYFPAISLHASTLLSANNSGALQSFAEMGFERAVLARELTLKEIGIISHKSPIEIEVFVHGAMCFSYSGLCLFSSFLGGKSGLRGKCVQPCRRNYTWKEQGRRTQSSSGHKNKQKNKGSGKKGKYLFSMNDLSGLEAIPHLRQAQVSSLKIEGRLRSAHYVSHIVQAYRLVIDADVAEFPSALQKSQELVDMAMGRSTSSGYFFSPQPANAITPHHSGNMGSYLGRLGAVKPYQDRLFAKLTLQNSLGAGDRLRLHAEPGGERISFSLKELRKGNEEIQSASVKEKVQLLIPDWKHLGNAARLDVYRVDVKKKQTNEGIQLLGFSQCKRAVENFKQQQNGLIQEILRQEIPPFEEGEFSQPPNIRWQKVLKKQKDGKNIRLPLEYWLRLDSAKTLLGSLPFVPDRFLLPITRANIAYTGGLKRYLGRRMRNLTWCLPAIVFEGEQVRLQKQIQTLVRSGFRSFQLGHISQFVFFYKEKIYLSSDYTVNLLNSQAVKFMEEGEMEYCQLSIESDKKILGEMLARLKKRHANIKTGLTVYGAPALFTARLDPDHFQYNKPLISPKQEQFRVVKNGNVTNTVPARPFSLLPYLGELKAMGLDYAVIDISNTHCGKKDLEELAERMAGIGKIGRLPTFNYLGTLE